MPSEQHARLRSLLGTWTGEETLFPSPWDPNGGTARGTLVCRLAVNGLYVVTDYREEREGRVVFEGHGVYGFDDVLGVYTMYWFDPGAGGGPAAPVPGRWSDDTLTFERESPAARYVYHFEAADLMTFRVEHAPDGVAFRPFLEGRYAREPFLT